MRWIVMFVMAAWGFALAAPPTPTTPAPIPRIGVGAPLVPGYRLQPGDEIEININSLPAFTKTYTVRVDGRFYHPFLGEIEASGRTLDDLRFYIRRRLQKELKDPGFDLGLVSYARNEMIVLGEARSPGKIQFLYGATVLDALALAGGLGEKADPQTATLVRAGQSIEVDLTPTGAARTLRVQSGDVLYVLPGLLVSVNGEVWKAGIYAISRRTATPIADALKLAGGAKPTAALSRTRLIRPSLPGPLEINILADSQGVPNANTPPLESGDALFLPERQAMLMGAVSKNVQPLPNESAPLLDVLSTAGVAANAMLEKVTVVRAADLKEGRDKREEYDVRALLTDERDENVKDIPAARVRVSDGDVVYVPARAENGQGFFSPQNAFSFLILLRSLFAF